MGFHGGAWGTVLDTGGRFSMRKDTEEGYRGTVLNVEVDTGGTLLDTEGRFSVRKNRP